MTNLRKSAASIALVVTLALVPGCTPAAMAALASVLGYVTEGAAYTGVAIDAARAGADVYFARHPNEAASSEVREALASADDALAMLRQAVELGDAASKADLDAARAALESAYGRLYRILVRHCVVQACAPAGGAETDAPEPMPLDGLADPGQVAAHLWGG